MTLLRRIADYFTRGHREWHEHSAVFKVTLIDGTRADGWLMRRKRNGSWEYRAETEAECADRMSANAW